MSDDKLANPVEVTAGQSGPLTAGGMLREARQANGMHIAVLAAALKVSPQKLEQLEEDHYDQFPDLTFVRALAQSICRTLKVDPVPVLALLPRGGAQELDRVAQGLNEPFREAVGGGVLSPIDILKSPAVWLPVLIILAAMGVYFFPQNKVASDNTGTLPSNGVTLPTQAASSPTLVPNDAAVIANPAVPSPDGVATAASSPAGLPASVAASTASSDVGAVVLRLTTTAASWVELVDSDGKVVFSRTLKAGEDLPIEVALPVRARIGNAAGTKVFLRGKAVDLTADTQGNVIRTNLK